MAFIFKSIVVFLLLATPLQSSAAATKETVVINALMLSSKYRATFSDLVQRFNAENDTIELKYELFPNEKYHTKQSTCLDSAECPVDIFLGFAGYGFEEKASRGQFASIENLWKEDDFDDYFSNLKKSVTVQNKPYGLPLSYYPWGFFYKKSLFEKLNLTPPKSWQEFLHICEVLKSANIAPIVSMSI